LFDFTHKSKQEVEILFTSKLVWVSEINVSTNPEISGLDNTNKTKNPQTLSLNITCSISLQPTKRFLCLFSRDKRVTFQKAGRNQSMLFEPSNIFSHKSNFERILVSFSATNGVFQSFPKRSYFVGSNQTFLIKIISSPKTCMTIS